MSHPDVRWTVSDPDIEAASQMLARLLPQNSDYISHSEMQHGLSVDGETWIDGAAERLSAYGDWLREEDRATLGVAFVEGRLVGLIVVTWDETAAPSYATIQDMVVDTEARGTGIGAALLALVKQEAAGRNITRLFLESGKRNVRAHAFFERAGFAPVSHIFSMAVEHDI